MYQKILNISIVLVLILGFAAPVFAQTEVEHTGTVLSIDGSGTFQLYVSDTETFTVVPPIDFDLAILTPGDTVMVKGTLTDSTIAATSILLSGTWSGSVQSVDTDTVMVEIEGVVYTVTPPDGFDLTILMAGDIVEITGWLSGTDITADTMVVVAVSIDVTGTVYSVGAGEFVLDVDSVLYTVIPPAGFDLTLIQAGDMVRVVGTLQAETITASQVLLPVEYVGTVVVVEADGTFQFQAKDGPLFMVTPPDGYDWSMLMAGDVLIVRGWLEGSMIYATNISVLFAGDGEGNKGGYYCENLDDHHPVAERLAEEYGMYYEQIMSWFCVNNFGFGEIKNAFKAEMLQIDGYSAAEILAMKEALGGWGEVKQALGLIGPDKVKEEKNREEVQLIHNEKKADNGKPENPGNSDKDKETGPPAHANDKVKDKDKK